MAVKIRLSRIGKKKAPKYRIIVADEREKREGRYIENIGFYDPIPNPYILKINEERLNFWLNKGAQLSCGLLKLIKSKKITKLKTL